MAYRFFVLYRKSDGRVRATLGAPEDQAETLVQANTGEEMDALEVGEGELDEISPRLGNWKVVDDELVPV